MTGGALLPFKSELGDRIAGVNKVDVMEARRGLQPIGEKPPSGPATHAPYRREPYVRAQLDDGRTVDAKAAAWTRTHVLLHWKDADGKAWNVWVVAERVRRIRRRKVGGGMFMIWSGEGGRRGGVDAVPRCRGMTGRIVGVGVLSQRLGIIDIDRRGKPRMLRG